VDIVNLTEYKWVIQNRNVLLDFCRELKPEDFTRQLDGFGFQSVREALVHIANCYIAWLGSYILLNTRKPISSKEEVSQFSLDDIRQRFEQADLYVYEVMELSSEQLNEPIKRKIPWRETGEEISITPLQLLMHTITHEYHHKGQIVAMARQMGYVPPNTDVLGAE
jgi:uncharacterized damage-inducible protein DinB